MPIVDNNFHPLEVIDEEQLEKGRLTKEDTSTATAGFQDLSLYFKSAVGSLFTFSVCFYFFVVHGIRIGSD